MRDRGRTSRGRPRASSSQTTEEARPRASPPLLLRERARSEKTIASAVATFAPVPRWRGARAALGPFRGRRIAGATLLRRGIAEPLPPARVAAAAPRLIPGGRDDVLDRHRGLDLHLPRL